MGYSVQSNYVIPWGIGLYPIANATSNTKGVTDKTAQNPIGVKSGSKLTIGWHADGTQSTFQVQWRWMRRLNPAQAILIDSGGSDIWYAWNGADLSSGTQGSMGEWGAWQGSVLANEDSISSMPRGGGAANPDRTFYLWNPSDSPAHVVEIAIPYDMTTYDAAKLQIQVRCFNFPLDATKKVSEWGSAEVFIGFIPTSSTTAGRNDDGTVTLSVNTNWTRGGNLVQFPAFYNSDGLNIGGGINEVTEDDFELTIPAQYAPESTLYFNGATFTTSDGIAYDLWANELGGDVQSLAITTVVPVTPITEPTVTIDEDGNVKVADNGYDSVLMRASYVDEEGNSYSELVTLTLDDGYWTGTIPTPPLDVDVNFTTVCIVGGDWDSWTKTAKVDSGGYVMFDWPDSDGLRIKYNPDRQVTVSLLGSVVSIMGDELPVSRKSLSRTSSMTMTGTLINPAEDLYNGDAWLAQLEVLNEPHDWIFRTPNGMRRRVSIESYTPAWATQSANRVMDVTIVMEEVKDSGLD